MNARQTLAQWAACRIKMGLPPLIDLFVLRNGQPMTAARRPKGIRRSTPKMCFRNATHLAFDRGFDYCEGFVITPRTGDFPILHAWTASSDQVIDNTLKDPQDCSYFGVRFTHDQLRDTLMRTGVYGLLDPCPPNTELMFGIDPLLEQRILTIMNLRRHPWHSAAAISS